MAIFDATNAIKKAGRTPTRGRTTGVAENFAASFDAFAESQMSISKQSNTVEETQDILNKLSERGVSNSKLPSPPIAGGTRPGTDGQTLDQQVESFFKQVRAIGEENPEAVEGLPKSEGDLDRIIAREATEAAEEQEDVAFRASTLGQVGSFAGTAAGAAVDPPVLASLFLGAPASAGIVRTAATEAGIGAATEVPVQAGVQTTRAELGLDASVERAVKNIAAAGIGGGLFAGAFRAAGEGIRSLRRGARERQLQRLQRERQSIEARAVTQQAREIQRTQPEQVEADPVLKSAVNNQTRIGEIQQNNVFTKDLPTVNRAFNETFDAVMTKVQETGRVPNVQTRLPVDVTTGAERVQDILPDTAATARRGVGRDAAEADTAGSVLGDALRQRVTRQAEDEATLDATRRVIGRVIDETPNKTELGQTLKSASQVLDTAKRYEALDNRTDLTLEGRRAQRGKLRKQFMREFQEQFPNAERGQAEAFLQGESDLRAAVETIRNAGADLGGDRSGAGLLDLGPDQVANALREFMAPLQENAAVGRSVSDIQQRQMQTERMAEELETQIETLRQFARDDVDGNLRFEVEDEAGNKQPTTVKDILNSADEDERLLRALEECVGGTTQR